MRIWTLKVFNFFPKCTKQSIFETSILVLIVAIFLIGFLTKMLSIIYLKNKAVKKTATISGKSII